MQDEAGGIAQALGLARRFRRGGRLAVILGDNIFRELDPPLRRRLPQGNRVVKITEYAPRRSTRSRSL